MNVAIINTYLGLRKNLPPGSPGEWSSIYPPFEKGFGTHDAKWQYMNGGVAGHAMGELARGAYENGFEDYASDIMKRMLDLAKQYGNRLWFAYTGSIPPPPPTPIRIRGYLSQANMDLRDQGGAGIFSGDQTRRAMVGQRTSADSPAGSQVFHGIKFNVLNNPDDNQRRAVVAVSTKPGFPRETEISVHDTASAVYLLHSSSDNIPSRIAGAMTFVYADGTEASRYLFKGEEVTNWWFPSLQNEKAGVAWWGPNPRRS